MREAQTMVTLSICAVRPSCGEHEAKGLEEVMCPTCTVCRQGGAKILGEKGVRSARARKETK